MTDDRPAALTFLDDAPATPSPAPARTRRANGAAESRRRVSVFIHEPFGEPRRSGLRVGVITDGTSRGGPNGIAEGAMRVVECAERCAQRDDVGLYAAFILSPQNVARRQRAFFAALHAEFLRLAEKVVSGRALAGVRIELHGRLDRLERKGGAAARLAHVLALLCEKTAAIPSHRLQLVFCVDYDEDTPLALGLDLLLRTGMEEPLALRLSGLRVQPSTVCIPYMKLWRDFTASDLDGALALAARHARPGLAAGFSSAFIAELVSELARAGFSSPLQLTLPLAASAEETATMLASIAFSSAPSSVEVIAELGPRGALERVGSRHALVQVQLVTPGLRRLAPPGDPVAWLAPGQPTPVFHLLERSAGDANVHTCEPTPAGIVEGLRRALGFQAAHPPLHGAPRALHRDELGRDCDRIENLIHYVSGRKQISADVVARELDGGGEAGLGRIGEIFAAARMAEARASGLFSGEVDWRRQAFGYAITAFAIGFQPSLAASDWEPAARAVAHVMLALASSDEEITDRVFPGEDRHARRGRLTASVDYLIARIRGEPRDPPRVHGAGILDAIGCTWERFFGYVAPAADPAILAGVKQAAEALYRANFEELSRTDPLVAALMRCPSAQAADAVERRHATSAPEPVARRMRELLEGVRREPEQVTEESWRELRLLCRLSRVTPSIGAGCALLAMAATAPAYGVPAGGATTFLGVARIIDYYFRLANDLSFADATRGDRDGKPNSFTCLIPAGLVGKAREQASVDALRTCRATVTRLNDYLRMAIGELACLWPLGARWLERGMHAGRRAYELGHYERLTPEALTGILAEIEPHVRLSSRA